MQTIHDLLPETRGLFLLQGPPGGGLWSADPGRLDPHGSPDPEMDADSSATLTPGVSPPPLALKCLICVYHWSEDNLWALTSPQGLYLTGPAAYTHWCAILNVLCSYWAWALGLALCAPSPSMGHSGTACVQASRCGRWPKARQKQRAATASLSRADPISGLRRTAWALVGYRGLCQDVVNVIVHYQPAPCSVLRQFCWRYGFPAGAIDGLQGRLRDVYFNGPAVPGGIRFGEAAHYFSVEEVLLLECLHRHRSAKYGTLSGGDLSILKPDHRLYAYSADSARSQRPRRPNMPWEIMSEHHTTKVPHFYEIDDLRRCINRIARHTSLHCP